MSTLKLFVLPGDGIGPEVMAEVEKIANFLTRQGVAHFEIERGLVGGAAYDAHQVAISEDDMARAGAADAILLAAVGGPKWDKVPYDVRPEAGLLRLRKDFDLYANLRPAICYPALADASSLKRELVDGLDLMIVRELTGGVYFGEPKQIIDLGNGQKRAIDTQVYDTYEIERIGRVAFELARKRRNKVTSSEKHNVMKSGVLWREIIIESAQARISRCRARTSARRRARHAARAPAETVRRDRHRQSLRRHALGCRGDADRLARHAALGLARRGRREDRPAQGALRAGAWLGARYRRQGPRQSDRDDRLVRHGAALFLRPRGPRRPDRSAIARVLDKGLRTADIKGNAPKSISTAEMGDAILTELKASLQRRHCEEQSAEAIQSQFWMLRFARNDEGRIQPSSGPQAGSDP